MNEDLKNSLADNLMGQLIPFGYQDIKATAEVLYNAGVNFDEFAEYIYSNYLIIRFIEDTEIKFDDLDICALAYEYILQEARAEIEKETGQDILEKDICVAGNYMCSSFDNTAGANDYIDKCILNGKFKNPSKLLKAFFDMIEVTTQEEQANE